MAVKKKYGALGRGLDALIVAEDINTSGSSKINEIELSLIDVNPNQPRREFDEEALKELSESIKEIGIIQPITLREMPNHRYQIIAGERRYRASLLSGLSAIPAYIRTVDDETMMEMALVENIQRQDLNSIEVALAYQHLIEQYKLTQEALASRVGKSRASIANFIRLLKLPSSIQIALQNHKLEMGHARALLSLEDPMQQIRVFKEIEQKGYSVRKVENLVRNIKEGRATISTAKKISNEDDTICRMLSNKLDSNVKIARTAKGGRLTIAFKDNDQLEKLIELLQ